MMPAACGPSAIPTRPHGEARRHWPWLASSVTPSPWPMALAFAGCEYNKMRRDASALKEHAEELIRVSKEKALPGWLPTGISYRGEATAMLGQLQEGIAQMREGLTGGQTRGIRMYQSGVLCTLAGALAKAGLLEQGLTTLDEALALVEKTDQRYWEADLHRVRGELLLRDAEALKDHAEELIRLSNEKSFAEWLGNGICFRGEALAMLGQVQEGMAHIREGMAVRRSRGGHCHLTGAVGSLAEAQARAEHPEEGLATLAEALAMVEEKDERHWEAELHRLRAELLLMQGEEAEAEASFHKAIEVARRQNAKSWELRATTSLAYLWQKQGKVDEARRVIEEIYGWFAEGFDTPDLKEAKALLDELT